LSDRKKNPEHCGAASNACILLLTKYPQKGVVKQRLARNLPENKVIDLYGCFVLDSIETLKASGIPFSICYYPRTKIGGFQSWLGTNVTYIPQRGRDLGQRLRNAFSDAFNMEFEKVIAIGSDSPDLPVRVLVESSTALDSHDAVIGPSTDGGYYLIGFSRRGFLPNAFEGIHWSTSQVFEDTLSKLEGAGLKTHILQRWSDIDTMDDLSALFQNLCEQSSFAPRTMRFICENKALLR